ncbi:hypothetical protein AB3X93_44310, partial [Paraburkholderia sp. BR14262]|uniref:hypothetical protein n=1 Tax=Paraburkholderia sp. BR14262 TaxID=3236999 RepID=UPI0034CDA41B
IFVGTGAHAFEQVFRLRRFDAFGACRCGVKTRFLGFSGLGLLTATRLTALATFTTLAALATCGAGFCRYIATFLTALDAFDALFALGARFAGFTRFTLLARFALFTRLTRLADTTAFACFTRLTLFARLAFLTAASRLAGTCAACAFAAGCRVAAAGAAIAVAIAAGLLTALGTRFAGRTGSLFGLSDRCRRGRRSRCTAKETLDPAKEAAARGRDSQLCRDVRG